MIEIKKSSAIMLCIVLIASAVLLAGCGLIDRGQDVTGFWQDQDRRGTGKL